MSRSLLVGILIFVLILIGLATFSNGLLALAILLIFYLASVLVFGPDDVQIGIQREISPERVAPGEVIDLTITITNHGANLEEVFISDRLPPNLEVIDGSTSIVTVLEKNQTIELTYQVHGKRGIYFFDGIDTSASDTFGLYSRSKMIPVQSSIFIMPHVPKLKRVAIRPRQTRVYSGSIPARIGGPGIEFFGVREYHSGDTLARINWRASARHQETLYSNEFMQERVTDVGLILDARQVSDVRTPAGNLFEYLITAVAALTDTLINDGNRVGLLIYGQFLDWTYPRYGKVQRERILRALALAQTGDSLVFEKLDNLPTRMFPNHSQLILFSSLLEEDVPFLSKLRARGYQVMVISPNPNSFQVHSMTRSKAVLLGNRLAQIERKLVFDRLRHTGIVTLDWDVSTPFDQAMQPALSNLNVLSGYLHRRI